ncbi:MAG TPA: mechanosensitive ion channel [Melioribacteraceae bacterium]|nr:mechanosensitive ion channel [Melioribacteraceae bacterium]
MKNIFILVLFLFCGSFLAQSELQDTTIIKDSTLKKENSIPQKIYKYFDTVKAPILPNTKVYENTLENDLEALNIFKYINFWTIFRILVLLTIAIILNKLLDYIRKNKKIREEYLFTARLITIIKIFLWLTVIYLLLYQLFSNTIEIILIFVLVSIIFVGISFIDVFKNIVGGFYISLKNPFEISDFINIKEFTGKVKRINWLTTQLITEAGCEVHIPNAFFIYSAIKNINKGEREKQITFNFRFPNNIDINLLKKILTEAALSSPFTYVKQKPEVFLIESNYAEKWYEFKVNIYCIDSLLENQLKNSINLHINNALKTENLLNE